MTNCPSPVVLCDANFSCIPLALSIQGRGHGLSVCGGLPADPCHQYGNSSLDIDYSNESLLLEVVRKAGAQFLVAGCNDRSYLSCSYVAEQLGLPGYDSYETTLLLQEKDRFRTYATRQGYPIPRLFEDSKDAVVFPVLVKPIDAFSGRGISKVEGLAELPLAIENARASSQRGKVIVEAFVEGSLHSHSAFIRNGRIVLEFFVDEFCTVYEYQVNSSCLSTALTRRVRSDVHNCIAQVVTDLGLCDGLLHTQFIARDEKFWLIELTRRCPGDLYSSLVQYSTGIDYASLYVSGFLGESVPENVASKERRYIARHTASTQDAGYLFGLRHEVPARDVKILQLKKCGDYLKAAPFDKAAILFAEFYDEKQMSVITPHLRDFIDFDMLPLAK